MRLPVLTFLFAFTAFSALLYIFHEKLLLALNYHWIRKEPKARKGPFIPLENFPERTLLEENWQTIRDEALLVYDTAPQASKVSKVAFGPLNTQNKWKTFVFNFYGEDYTINMAKCPQTTKLLKQIPRIKFAMFSIMLPGNYVPPHTGKFKPCMRYHLGLQIPKDRRNCFINLDGKNYHWKEGEGVLFDDTYKHWVLNNTDEVRIILFCDVQRENLGKGVQWMIDKSNIPRIWFNLNNKNEKTQNI